MFELSDIYNLISMLPFEVFEAKFMQRALLALLLITPIAATLGIWVINFKMSFFSDAISHSAFSGIAIGLLLSLNPKITMVIFGVIAGLLIITLKKHSNLSSDTAIGVTFSAIISMGLIVVNKHNFNASKINYFLYGDILTISDSEIKLLFLLFIITLIFHIFSFNKLLYMGINPSLSKAHGIRVDFYEYLFSVLLATIVMFSVWAVGILLVTALLIVPSATARRLSNNAKSMFWWTIFISISSSIIGLLASSTKSINTPTGASVILITCIWFLLANTINRVKA